MFGLLIKDEPAFRQTTSTAVNLKLSGESYCLCFLTGVFGISRYISRSCYDQLETRF